MRYLMIAISFFITAAFARVVKYEVVGSKKERYSYYEVCEKMGRKHLLIVELIDNEVDCMGTKVAPADFCKTVFLTDHQYIRAYIDFKKSQVICQKAKEVALSITCDSKKGKFCEDPKVGCTLLKETFATNHNLVHQTMSDNQLNCHYSCQKI